MTSVKKEGGIVKVDVEAAKGGNKETVSLEIKSYWFLLQLLINKTKY